MEKPTSFEPAERPNRVQLAGAALVIAVMGARGFRIELGPNADTPELPPTLPETSVELMTPLSEA